MFKVPSWHRREFLKTGAAAAAAVTATRALPALAAGPARVPESVVQAIQRTLNRFRERLGLPPSFARPAGLPDIVPASIEVMRSLPSEVSVG